MIGHGKIIEYLQKSIEAGRLAHAYLFCGPRHTGKSTLAGNFVSSLLCRGEASVVPCKVCLHCRQIAAGVHPDCYFVEKEEGKKNISIEQIRELRRQLGMKSMMDSYKIAVVRGAQDMNREAFNSFLKTLEEPAEKTIVIMLAENIGSFPKTILSRCQTMNFVPVPVREIREYLVEEGMGAEKADDLARLSMGRPGIAVRYSENPELLADHEAGIREFLALCQATLPDRFALAEKMSKDKGFVKAGKAIADKFFLWSLAIRDMVLISSGKGEDIVNGFAEDDLRRAAGRRSREDLVALLEDMERAKRFLARNASPRLVLENFLLGL